MKVQELLMNIKNKEFKLSSGIGVKTYLPIEIKKTIAQGIIFECTNDDLGVIKVDSVQRYLSYVKHMIVSHTNLDYADEDYDVLCYTEYGDTNLLNAILDCFGDDAQECSRILNLMMDDYMQEMSVEFAVMKFLNNINASISDFATKLGNVNMKSMLPENVDMDTLSAFLQKYVK